MAKVYHRDPNLTTQVCYVCNQEKPLSEFHKAPRNTLKVLGICRKCRNNPHRRIVQLPLFKMEKWCYACNRELPIENFAISKDKKDGHTARCNECQSRYYHARAKKYIALACEYQRTHPEMVKSRGGKRRAQKMQAITDNVNYQNILERDGLWCYICEKDIASATEVHFDHVIPLSRKGSHTEENIKVTHGVCNLRKNKRLISEMTPYQRRGP